MIPHTLMVIYGLTRGMPSHLRIEAVQLNRLIRWLDHAGVDGQ